MSQSGNSRISKLLSYQSIISSPSTDGSRCSSDPNMNGAGAERESLLQPGTSVHRRRSPVMKIFILSALLALGTLLGTNIQRALSTSIFDPAVRDQIRHQWDLSYARHEHRLEQMTNLTKTWEAEVERHSERRKGMIQERAQWDTERRQRGERWESERKAMEEQHTQRRERMALEFSEERAECEERWESERKVMEEHHAEQREAMALVLAEERAEWEFERQAWVDRKAELAQEIAHERAKWDSERQAWERVRQAERMEEVDKHRREREKAEKEEERQRAGIHWLSLQRSAHCERYGTRKYFAKLGPIIGGYDSLEASRTTEVEIHGRKLKPSYCDDQGTYGGMWGNWMVDFNEGACRTWWGDYTDKGCTAAGSGLRRIEANLKNHDAADEWTVMCSSTPAHFNGLDFEGAMSCANWGKRGIFGFWEIDDGRCR